MNTLGVAIKEAREAGGLSRAELAEQAGISSVYVEKIEQGSRRPSPAKLAALAKALKVSAAELMTRAALLDASTAPTNDELARRLLRAAATGAGGQAVLSLLGPAALVARPFAASRAAGIAVSMVEEFVQFRRQRAVVQNPHTQDQPGTSQPRPEITNPRQELLELVATLSDEEIRVILLEARAGDDA